MKTKDQLRGELASHNQQHLLAFWEELDEPDRQTLLTEIESVDFDQLAKLVRGENRGEDWAALAAAALPPPAVRLDDRGLKYQPKEAAARGEQALSAGQVGAILVAGGQGTRLGFDHPKGMFPIGPISGSSLFQILFEKIAARARRHAARIPLYVMTSPATHQETVEYLAGRANFGIPEQDVKVFCQGTMPAVDQSGRLLLAEKGRLFLSPDGHGGMLSALAKSGCLADMRARGVRQLFYFQVDNPLVSMCDPQFLGYHLLYGSEMSTQVVAKQTPRDKVGSLVLIDGKLRIIEYSDLNPLSDALVVRRGQDQTPVFWAGNTAIHVFEAEFLQRVSGMSEGLPFHFAKKAVPYVDASGVLVQPSEPNAVKFERFIFDLLPLARQGIAVEVDEAQHFAPVKNAPGDEKDTPESVRKALVALHRGWLHAAGCRVDDGVPVEISPLYAQDKAEVAQKVPPPHKVTVPRYFSSK